MVWGCFSRKGVGNLVHIPTTMDKHVYLDILQKNLKASARSLGLSRNFVFQQDNDPKHTSGLVKTWLSTQKNMVCMDWPAQSPDLNPIENLWAHLGRKMSERERRPKNATELVQFLTQEWQSITSDITTKLVDSMPNRIAEVIKMKGGYSHY